MSSIDIVIKGKDVPLVPFGVLIFKIILFFNYLYLPKMKIKISSIDIIPLQLKLTEPFVISKGPLHHARITVIKIYTDQGLYGIGECCPFRTIHGETQAGSVASAKELASLLIGQDPCRIRRLVQIMDKSLAGHASIKGAFDMALYDLNAKIAGQPLYQYLNGDPDKEIYTDMTVSLLAQDEMVAKAVKYQEQGFPSLKIKLGDRSGAMDIKRMKAIRNAVGPDLPLCIDANQGWNYNEAVHALKGMEGLDIMHCEAPIFAGNIIHLKSLRGLSPIPIMGDESIFSHKDAFQMLALGCIDLINIKIGKSGGITHAMKIAAIAESHDIYCQVGCFSESRLGISALVHFATAWDNIVYFDLDAPLMHSEDPIIGGITYHKDWRVTLPSTPGIGADYDPAFLSRFDCMRVIS